MGIFPPWKAPLNLHEGSAICTNLALSVYTYVHTDHCVFSAAYRHSSLRVVHNVRQKRQEKQKLFLFKNIEHF